MRSRFGGPATNFVDRGLLVSPSQREACRKTARLHIRAGSSRLRAAPQVDPQHSFNPTSAALIAQMACVCPCGVSAQSRKSGPRVCFRQGRYTACGRGHLPLGCAGWSAARACVCLVLCAQGALGWSCQAGRQARRNAKLVGVRCCRLCRPQFRHAGFGRRSGLAARGRRTPQRSPPALERTRSAAARVSEGAGNGPARALRKPEGVKPANDRLLAQHCFARQWLPRPAQRRFPSGWPLHGRRLRLSRRSARRRAQSWALGAWLWRPRRIRRRSLAFPGCTPGSCSKGTLARCTLSRGPRTRRRW